VNQTSRFLDSTSGSASFLSLHADAIVGFVLGSAVTLIVAYVFYLFAKQEKRPLWTLQTNVGSATSMHPKGETEPIHGRSVSWVAFWNAGTTAILWADNPRGNPLCLRTESEDDCLLEIECVGNHVANQIRVPPASARQASARMVPVEFDNIGPGHGCVLTVVHTDLPSAGVRLEGELINALPLERVPTHQAFAGRWAVPAVSIGLVTGLLIYGALILALGAVAFVVGGGTWLSLWEGARITGNPCTNYSNDLCSSCARIRRGVVPRRSISNLARAEVRSERLTAIPRRTTKAS